MRGPSSLAQFRQRGGLVRFNHRTSRTTADFLPMPQGVGALLDAVSFVALQPPRHRLQTRWHSEPVSRRRSPPASGRLRCDRGHCHTRVSRTAHHLAGRHGLLREPRNRAALLTFTASPSFSIARTAHCSSSSSDAWIRFGCPGAPMSEPKKIHMYARFTRSPRRLRYASIPRNPSS